MTDFTSIIIPSAFLVVTSISSSVPFMIGSFVAIQLPASLITTVRNDDNNNIAQNVTMTVNPVEQNKLNRAGRNTYPSSSSSSSTSSADDEWRGNVRSVLFDVKMTLEGDYFAVYNTSVDFIFIVDNSSLADVDQLCLAYIDEDDDVWVCEDSSLRVVSVSPPQLKGTTTHFTSFAIIVSPRQDAPHDNDASSSPTFAAIPMWGVIFGVIGAVLGGVIFVVVLFVVLRKRDKKKQEIELDNTKCNDEM
eukprot:TRINITY_DN3465_c2_g1_i6.p1 TRINITY_DN3465_c2_g1~~TRINITY_DN3465_c2_g1_i6.p1  ORF type:complete len:262 (-),score=62.00 TRINITY_DN3465_c2_g1_i6:49-792(-)